MGGYELMVDARRHAGPLLEGFQRRRCRSRPNVVTPFTVDLHEQLHRFLKGHRIMVQVQSTWFPLYDRNPQIFLQNIFDARATDFRAQQHRVWHTVGYPSHISVLVLP